MSTLEERGKARAERRAVMFEGGGPAFPMDNAGYAEPDTVVEGIRLARGMTMRDAFAMKSIPECLRIANERMTDPPNPRISDLFHLASKYSYAMADAMLNAREQTITKTNPEGDQ